MHPEDTLIRLGLALVAALPIGWEREASNKAAGLRTHLLVSLGCCLFTLVGLWMADSGGPNSSDPARIPAQIVTGIGFLGGGVIFRGGGAVRGLTTAASIWMVAAIGLACGCGYYLGAGVGSMGGLLILTVLERLEPKHFAERKRHALRIVVRGDKGVKRVRSIVDQAGLRVDSFRVEDADQGLAVLLEATCAPKLVASLSHMLFSDNEVVLIERSVAEGSDS